MRKLVMTVGALVGMTAGAFAQDSAARSKASGLSLEGLGSTLAFGLLGIVLATVGFKIFDLLIKADIEKEIFENKNVAAATLSAAFVLGISIIIAAAIL
jgi:uncharacterized membrane protein YjfL (UPF0719 family)